MSTETRHERRPSGRMARIISCSAVYVPEPSAEAKARRERRRKKARKPFAAFVAECLSIK